MNITINSRVFLFAEMQGEFFLDNPGNVSFAFLLEWDHKTINDLMHLVKEDVCLSVLFKNHEGKEFKTSWGAKAIYVSVDDFNCIDNVSTH